MSNYEELMEKQILGGIVLNVTDSCNLRCRYCFTHPNPSKMDLDTGIQAVNWLVEENLKKTLTKNEHLMISFFGGEPTLYWDSFMVPLIKYVESYIEPKYKSQFNFGFSCTTNGQLLNEERIKWFIEHKGSFLLSVDGNRETQNYNRPRIDGRDSFDKLEEIFPILLKYQPDITFRSTITPEMVHNLSNDYLYARSLGFKNWFGIPNLRQEWSQEAINTLNEEICKICGALLYDIEQGNPTTDFGYINKMIKIVMGEYPKQLHYMRCGFGTTSVGVATDGSLFACQENSTYHDETNPFFIGDVWSGIDTERHKKLVNKYCGEAQLFCGDKCENCVLKGKCQGWSCPSTNFALTGNILERTDMTCEWLRILYFNCANLILNAARLDSDNFIRWFQKNTEITGGMF